MTDPMTTPPRDTTEADALVESVSKALYGHNSPVIELPDDEYDCCAEVAIAAVIAAGWVSPTQAAADRAAQRAEARANLIVREEAAPHESADALPVRGDGDLADPATYNAAIDAQIASVADLPHDEQVEALAMRYVTLKRVYRDLRVERGAQC